MADGSADTYNNLNNEIGLSGNYHETNGLCPDGDGGYFIAAGTASHNGPTFWHTHWQVFQDSVAAAATTPPCSGKAGSCISKTAH